MKASLKNIKANYQRALVKQGKRNFFDRIRGYTDKYLAGDRMGENNINLIDTNLAMYTEVRQFGAFLTKNAYDMSIYNEYDAWPHVNFGTIDNPVLIFGAGTTWRMVGCTGPASEEESSSHEKMYFIVREGAIHRCLFCGQCYKIVKLKDDLMSEENVFYSSIFTQIAEHNVGYLGEIPAFTFAYTQADPKNTRDNIIPRDRMWAFLNSDEADHVMVDPAHRLAVYKEFSDAKFTQNRVSAEITQQQRLSGNFDLLQNKITMDKDMYETWINIEREILKFDRIYNRYEKFEGRKLFDPENHERRERRMLQRQHERLNENYTFYSEGLTEKEQMYRDYFESDIEEFPDDDYYNEKHDEAILMSNFSLNPNLYDFVEGNTDIMSTKPVDSFVDQLLFKHRYRMFGDINYVQRNKRVIERMEQRAQNRDPNVTANLGNKIEEIYAKKGLLQDYSKVEEELLPFANYIAEEGFQQFKDYYESDIESGLINGDLLEDLNERDRLKFSECFNKDFTKRNITDKQYIMIPKRPFDNNKSVVNNFILDLVDFNYRVKPLARHLVYRDVSAKYQPIPMNEEEVEMCIEDEERYVPVLEIKKSSLENKKI